METLMEILKIVLLYVCCGIWGYCGYRMGRNNAKIEKLRGVGIGLRIAVKILEGKEEEARCIIKNLE